MGQVYDCLNMSWPLRLVYVKTIENIDYPNANLSRCMRHLNGVYTQKCNVSQSCDAKLFRGRYESILVDADTYLLQLMAQKQDQNLGRVLDSKSHLSMLGSEKFFSWIKETCAGFGYNHFIGMHRKSMN